MKHFFPVFISLFLFVTSTEAQDGTTHYGQFWSEVQFTRALKGKWGMELNLGFTNTSLADQSNIFYKNSQVYLRGWVHYYPGARWKLSYFYSFFLNKDVPEINQAKSVELRSAFQGIYYIRKINYTLSTRFRIEDRNILNNDGAFEAVYRFRGQLKYVQPFNSKTIRAKTIYGIASEELFVKTKSNVTGPNFFDRNRFTAGLGYSINDNIQVEMTYANEYLPRKAKDEVYNALQVNLTFNNLIPNISKKLKKEK